MGRGAVDAAQNLGAKHALLGQFARDATVREPPGLRVTDDGSGFAYTDLRALMSALYDETNDVMRHREEYRHVGDYTEASAQNLMTSLLVLSSALTRDRDRVWELADVFSDTARDLYNYEPSWESDED